MKAKTPVAAKQPGADDLAQPVIDAGRDQMGADQPVGRCAADEIAAGDQPEIARARALGESAEGDGERICARRRAAAAGVQRAVGGEAEILRPVAHQQCDERHEDATRWPPGPAT